MTKHNHDAVGIYGNCPGCGTVVPGQKIRLDIEDMTWPGMDQETLDAIMGGKLNIGGRVYKEDDQIKE